MSRTNPQTASRIFKLLPYWAFMVPTPAPAGTMLMTCLGNARMMSGIQFAG